MNIYINHAAAICALGVDLANISINLFSATSSPLRESDEYSPGKPTYLGLVDELPQQADTRTNSLLLSALTPLLPEVNILKQRFGAHRIGTVIGSSTSGIAEGEQALSHRSKYGEFPPEFHYGQQELGASSKFVAAQAEVTGPCWTVSTACSSGAKALASAARLIQLGVCDAVIAGGADSLCRTTVQGFSVLNAVSAERCNPFSLNRSGINVGEGAGLMLVTREPSAIRLAGFGETSDAHHISAPEPTGKGAEAAQRLALENAELDATAINYINLHGTATEQNDIMESLAVARVFGNAIPCGSTKSLTGHTLGAAGALEAIFCWLTLQRNDGLLPAHLWSGLVDPDLAVLDGLAVLRLESAPRFVMSNSFAFGGNNISLILERYNG